MIKNKCNSEHKCNSFMTNQVKINHILQHSKHLTQSNLFFFLTDSPCVEASIFLSLDFSSSARTQSAFHNDCFFGHILHRFDPVSSSSFYFTFLIETTFLFRTLNSSAIIIGIFHLIKIHAECIISFRSISITIDIQ